MNEARKPAKGTTASGATFEGFTAEERAAMKERAQELKAEARRGSAAAKAVENEKAVLEKIAELPQPERSMARRLHELILASAPALAPKLWYGMPAYSKDGEMVCFFQSATKFKTRYATLGFSDAAVLDDGNFWPNAYALAKLTDKEEKQIAALVRKAVG